MSLAVGSKSLAVQQKTTWQNTIVECDPILVFSMYLKNGAARDKEKPTRLEAGGISDLYNRPPVLELLER